VPCGGRGANEEGLESTGTVDLVAEEVVALVDEHGRVVGSVPRSQMRRENLRHASTAVLVRRSDGRIYVHRRSPDKDWAPSCHDAAAGGVLKRGEEIYESAIRELEEELGITDQTLHFLGAGRYEDDTVRCLAHVYEVTFDGPITHADGEVVWGGWMTIAELGEHLADPSWPFVPDTRALLQRLADANVNDYAGLNVERSPR
jgi:8-oxo-dGTP pyrophosphatase MutT (NUDIX family)